MCNFFHFCVVKITKRSEQFGVKMVVVQETNAQAGDDKPLRITGDPEGIRQAKEAVMQLITPQDRPGRGPGGGGGGFGNDEYGGRRGGGDRGGDRAGYGGDRGGDSRGPYGGGGGDRERGGYGGDRGGRGGGEVIVKVPGDRAGLVIGKGREVKEHFVV